MPKISVIIPVYNVEKYLEQSLNSVLNQTLSDIEIICVNDGSSDSSLDILNEYASKDSRIKVISQENQGPGVARNNGIEIATGDYLMFLDPDDWYELDACEVAYNQISKNKNDVVVFNFSRFYEETETYSDDESWRIAPFKNDFENPHIELKNIKNYMRNAFTWTQIYSRRFIIENNIRYAQQKLGEDVLFFVKSLVLANNISVIQKPLYVYRERLTSISFTYEKYWMDLFNVRYQCLTEIEKLSNKFDYIYTYLAYSIRSLTYWHGVVKKNKSKIAKDFYNELQKYYKKIAAEYNVNEFKSWINYGEFKKICQYSFIMYNLDIVIKRIFSITNSDDKKHKIISFLGIKLKFKN